MNRKKSIFFSLAKEWTVKVVLPFFYFSLLQDFFRNLSHWIQQHMDMNDAGNFLIETCDDTVSRDLKQQLLLLNGRWRELFVKVKHVNATHFGIAHAPPKNIELYFLSKQLQVLTIWTKILWYLLFHL